jgi:hypothetical protein
MVCRLIGSLPMSRAGLGLKSVDERSRRASCRSLPYALKAADAETLKGLRSSCSRSRREKQFLVCNCDGCTTFFRTGPVGGELLNSRGNRGLV